MKDLGMSREVQQVMFYTVLDGSYLEWYTRQITRRDREDSLGVTSCGDSVSLARIVDHFVAGPSIFILSACFLLVHTLWDIFIFFFTGQVMAKRQDPRKSRGLPVNASLMKKNQEEQQGGRKWAELVLCKLRTDVDSDVLSYCIRIRAIRSRMIRLYSTDEQHMKVGEFA